MNIGDIAQQIVRMKRLMPEVNRTTVAIRFKDLITETLKRAHGDDSEHVIKWLEEDAERFLGVCQLVAPREPVDIEMGADPSVLASFIDKWSAVDVYRVPDTEDWAPMSQETKNVVYTMLTDLRKVLDESTKPGG